MNAGSPGAFFMPLGKQQLFVKGVAHGLFARMAGIGEPR